MSMLISHDSLSNHYITKSDSGEEPLPCSFSDNDCIEIRDPKSTAHGHTNSNQTWLWLGTLSASTDNLNSFSNCLSLDETQRVTKAKRKLDKLRFIIARGTLRILLASRLGEKANEIKFAYNEHGKPMLSDHPTLHFNLSHSGDAMLLTIAQEAHIAKIGVDIESVDRSTNILQIAKRHFSEIEFRTLEESDDSVRELKFFEMWTRKEAYIKATGLGLGQLLGNLPDPSEAIANRWLIQNIDTIDGYAAAIAIQKHNLNDALQLRCGRWNWA